MRKARQAAGSFCKKSKQGFLTAGFPWRIPPPGAALVFHQPDSAVDRAWGLCWSSPLYATGGVAQGIELLSILPGAFGAVLAPVVYARPLDHSGRLFAPCPGPRWPACRLRVEQIEQDLPVFLELLATLAQAGLGFDAALDEILESQPANRPLTEEFRIFQAEILSGRAQGPVSARLSRRVEVISLTILVSALLQVEQVGASVGRAPAQADDMRGRRRERALALAGLPGKLIFPLAIGFLPGFFCDQPGPHLQPAPPVRRSHPSQPLIAD